MKSAADPRHLKRIHTFKKLFSLSFKDTQYKVSPLKQIKKHLHKIDQLIQANAPEWPIEKLNKVDLAILRLAIFELKFDQKNTPQKVIIDEAVELAKKFGTENTPKFVNGVLGAIIKHD